MASSAKTMHHREIIGSSYFCNWNDDQTFSEASLGSAATRVNYQSSASEFNIVKTRTFGDKLADRQIGINGDTDDKV